MSNIARVLFSLFVFTVGIALIYGGIQLVALGGSSYYLIAGLAYLVLTVLFLLRKRLGITLSVAIFLATCAWAFYEVGQFSYWELLPRLVVPAIILTLSLWVGAALPDTSLNNSTRCQPLRDRRIPGIGRDLYCCVLPARRDLQPGRCHWRPQGRRALRHRSKLGVLWA